MRTRLAEVARRDRGLSKPPLSSKPIFLTLNLLRRHPGIWQAAPLHPPFYQPGHVLGLVCAVQRSALSVSLKQPSPRFRLAGQVSDRRVPLELDAHLSPGALGPLVFHVARRYGNHESASAENNFPGKDPTSPSAARPSEFGPVGDVGGTSSQVKARFYLRALKGRTTEGGSSQSPLYGFRKLMRLLVPRWSQTRARRWLMRQSAHVGIWMGKLR